MTAIESGTTARFLFEISEKPLGVVNFNAEEKISTPFRVLLTLASDEKIGGSEAVGHPALLTVKGPENDRYFNGMVTRFQPLDANGPLFLYEARVEPVAVLLSRGADRRVFQEKSTPDIVGQILDEAGIPADKYVFRLKKKYVPRRYRVQYREPSLHFMDRLLREDGLFYFFEHSRNNHVMVFSDDVSVFESIEGDRELPFRFAEGMATDKEFVYGFSFYRHGLAEKKDAPEIDSGNPRRIASGRRQAEGQSTCPRLIPGFGFDLRGHDVNCFNRHYILTEVRHSGAQSAVLEQRNWSCPTATYSNQFFAAPLKSWPLASEKTARPIVAGIQTAVVEGPEGHDVYTDRYGRVRARFTWDAGDRPEHRCCWLRFVRPLAGRWRGDMYTPRVGEEVVVDFIDGDPDRPVITGRLSPCPDDTACLDHDGKNAQAGGPADAGFDEIRARDPGNDRLPDRFAAKGIVPGLETGAGPFAR